MKKLFAVCIILLTIATGYTKKPLFVSVSHAATMEDYVTCSLVYAALFQASKNADHEGMLMYSRPRLQAVYPYMQENRDNPIAQEKLRETATLLEDEVRYTFVRNVTNAIIEEDPEKLEASMSRVFECDKAFGLATLPLPIKTKQVQNSSSFLQGFYEGCLVKQKRSPSPYSDAQIQEYCQCMTDNAGTAGMNAQSSDEETSRIINEIHNGCFARIK